MGVLIAVGMFGAYLAGTQSVEIAKEEPAAHTASVGGKTSVEAPLPEAEPEMEEYNPLDALPDEVKQSSDSAKQEVEQQRIDEESREPGQTRLSWMAAAHVDDSPAS